jgi:hypothetical protein
MARAHQKKKPLHPFLRGTTKKTSRDGEKRVPHREKKKKWVQRSGSTQSETRKQSGG